MKVFVCALAAVSLGLCLSAAAQTANSAAGALGDPLSQEVLRALQQRGGAQSIDPGVQSTVQVLPPSSTTGQPGAGQTAAPAIAGLSALERLMSLRAGQRLTQFGYDNFGRGSPLVVRQSGALQDNYILGAGDEIVAALHGQENANYRTRVDRDGRVVLPNLPPIAAGGRSFGAFRADLERAVSRAFVGTEVSVSVGAMRQITVRVVGEANAPGSYTLTGLSTALDALNLAGGVKKSGSLRNIQVVRAGRSLRLDLYSLLTNQGASSDVTLTDGDRIVVPILGGVVAVAGQVRRPAIYELPFGVAGLRASELLALAGGPPVRGAYRISVMRTGDDGQRRMQALGGADVNVRDGDALFVAAGGDAAAARVELMGATGSHGYFALGDAPSLRALLKSPDMFAAQPGQPLPYLLTAAVLRLDPQTLQRSVIAFSPVDVMNGKSDLPLQSNDVVYILNVAEMRYIARGAAQAAMREAENNGAAARPQANGRNADAPTVSAEALQTGAVNGAGPSPTGFGSNGTTLPNGPEAPQPVVQPPRPLAPLPPQRLPGPFGLAGNDDLPELGGIAAPEEPKPQTNESDSRGDSGTDRAQNGKLPLPSETAGRPALRLFIGLDDDQRQLLIRSLGHYYVVVGGEVNDPGAFLALQGVGLDRIVQAAGGVTPNVDLSGFEISSAEIDNQSGVSRTVRKTYKLAADQFSQVSLRPLDSIRFNKVFSDSAGQMTIYGEVRYPGSYAITRSERLSSVLSRAGGMTEAAYPYGVIFLRRSVAEQERGVLQREADALDSQLVGLMSTVSANKGQISDAEIQYVGQMMQRLRQAGGQGGRVAVQIDPKEVAAHPELDIVLEPGDQLFIPRLPNSVVVAGEVMSPSGIQFKPGRSVADYLAQAGGMTEIADTDHIFVIQPDGSAQQANGTSWLGDPPRLAPGSVIVVPRTLHPFAWDVVLQNVIQMTSQLAITAASISVISK